jgi:glycoside/pentoside/hexuronide:cation symporter, GPH family
MNQSSAPRPHLTLGTNLLCGVGSVAFGVHIAALSSLLMLFFNQVVDLPAAWVGAAMMVTLMFDAICDPLIGEWSDHSRSRWGRRHPFMYASAVPIAFAFYFLWNPPHGWSNQSLFIYLVALLVTVRLLLSFYEIPSIALAPELTLDYDQRTGLMSSRFFFRNIGRSRDGGARSTGISTQGRDPSPGADESPRLQPIRPGRRPLDVRVDHDFVSRHS